MGQKIILRPGVVPHKNLTRVHKPTESESQLSPASKKRKIEVLEESRSIRRKLYSESEPSTSGYDSTKLSTTSGKFIVVSSPKKITPTLVKTVHRYVMASPKMISKSTNTQRNCADKAVNTIKFKVFKPRDTSVDPQSNGSDSASTSDPTSQQSSSTSAMSLSLPTKDTNEELEIYKLENHSRFYLGLPKDCYFIINLIVEESRLYHTDVMITLKKIRTNDQLSRLGIDFVKSTSYISKIFHKTVPILANLMQQLIIWPASWKIKRLVPNQFKAYYSNVQAIIDCFEIEIEKPSSALNQAITWSDYKKCNTIKYLVSCTPNGLVNYVSCGFGGRATDVNIVQDSNFMDVLPCNSVIMADRGFKQVEQVLHTKNTKLLRPPSVSVKQKPSKKEVQHGKIISALRVHIERLIRRLREFSMLKPHACISLKLAHLLDYVVIIACGLVNLQQRLVKY